MKWDKGGQSGEEEVVEMVNGRYWRIPRRSGSRFELLWRMRREWRAGVRMGGREKREMQTSQRGKG
jgi:hypothetical protein